MCVGVLCYVYVRARVFVSVCFVLARLHQRILRKREPWDSKGLKEQGLYRKGLCVYGLWNGVWWRFTRFQHSVGVGVCHGDLVS